MLQALSLSLSEREREIEIENTQTPVKGTLRIWLARVPSIGVLATDRDLI